MGKPSTSTEFARFDQLARDLLAVPRAVIEERVAKHRESAAANPRKRGPKPKRTTASTSGRDEGEP
jgi:hypothetical protein